MASATKIADNSRNVKRHPTVRHHQIIAVVFKEQPTRHTAGTGEPQTAGIEGTDTADEAIGSEMSMAADYDLGVRSGEQRPELLISDTRFDPWAVIGSG